jgi:hypothetical protein
MLRGTVYALLVIAGGVVAVGVLMEATTLVPFFRTLALPDFSFGDLLDIITRPRVLGVIIIILLWSTNAYLNDISKKLDRRD